MTSSHICQHSILEWLCHTPHFLGILMINMSLSTPFFSHPNLPSTDPGNKIATTLKSEPKTPTLTEITTSVTNNQDYTPPTSVKECQDDQLDVVTIFE